MVELRVATRDQAPERLVNSEAALDATLAEASKEARAEGKLNVISLTAPNRDWLFIVVGGDETVVGYNYGHGNPPYYVSAGEAESDDPVLTAYVGFEHHTGKGAVDPKLRDASRSTMVPLPPETGSSCW